MALTRLFILVPCGEQDIEVCHTLAKEKWPSPVIRVSNEAFDRTWSFFTNVQRRVHPWLREKGIRNIYVDESIISLALANPGWRPK